MMRRIVVALMTAFLALGLVAGCSSEAGDVSCGTNQCDVTLNRGVDADVSVLGVSVKLVSVSSGTVTVEVGGTQVQIPVSDGQGTSAGNLNIRVTEVTDSYVKLVVTQQQ
jgi:hypothetical protein